MYLLIIVLIITVLLSTTMGGSGTGPSFSISYGANILKFKWIPILFAIMVFAGAYFAGDKTTQTVGKNLLNPDLMTYIVISIVLFSVFIAILIADIAGIPQSTSQATVFSVIAAAIFFNEFDANKFFYEILPTWFIAPLLSFVLCFLLGKYIYKPIRKTGLTISKKVNDNYVLKAIILIMSLYVAFSIGANNVANALGPLKGLANNELNISANESLIWLSTIFTIALFFGMGSLIFGKKILNNTGKEIILFGKFEAIIIAFVSGSILLFISLTNGIPTSLVQLNVAAIIGIGVAKLGFKNIFKKTEVNKFFVMWVVSPIIAFGLCYGLLHLCDYFEILHL
jgi:sulfate permease